MRILDAAKKQKQDDDAVIVPVLLTPYMLLKREHAFTANQLASHFDVMDRSIANGGSLLKSSAIGEALQPLIIKAHQQGFAVAAKLTGKKASQAYWDKIAAEAAKHAKKVNQWMLKSTANMLEDHDTDFVFSEARAARAAEYEMSQAFYQGVDAASAGSSLLKEWITADNPCDICIDNEDEGPIPVDEQFESGSDWPPEHVSCQCVIQLSKA